MEFNAGDAVEVKMYGTVVFSNRVSEHTRDQQLTVELLDADGDRFVVDVESDNATLYEPTVKWGEVYRKGFETYAVTGSGDGDTVIRRMSDGTVHPRRTLLGAQKIFDVDDTA
jgi:hypothetical protein